MKILFGNNRSNSGVVQVSPEAAAAKLRWKIKWHRFRHVGNAAWFAWLAFRTLLKALALALLEVVVFYMILKNMDLEAYSFIIGNAILLIGAFLEIRKKFGRFWKRNDGLFVGRSFGHFTSSVSNPPYY